MLKRKKVSSKKSKDVSWILDGIVGFLQSATWTIPIMDFVDDNCGCFESKEENKFEYTDIHEKYKALVERLLYKYMRELEISEDLFSKACDQHKSSIQPAEGVFEYIWAADDFILFKTIMTRHNVELDMQAMSLMKMQNYSGIDQNHLKNSGVEPNPKVEVDFILKKSKKEFAKASGMLKKLQEQEEHNYQRAVEFSKQESERLKKLIELENEMLEKAIRLSLLSVNDVNNSNNKSQAPICSVESSSSKPDFNLTLQNQSLLTANTTNKSKDKKETTKKVLNPLKQHKAVDITNKWIADVTNETRCNSSTTTDIKSTYTAVEQKSLNSIDPHDLAQRRDYLSKQREKILEAKRKQRQEELLLEENHQTFDSSQQEVDIEKEKMLKARRALAERLKREVINKTK